MAIKYLTVDEHRQVVERLVSLSAKANGVRTHASGLEYTSVMMCFLLHGKGASESLLTLYSRYGPDWFPATTGYLIVRSLFEVDVTAHYITAEPTGRSRRYIEFGRVIQKKRLDAIERHRNSHNPSWQEGMKLMYNTEWASKAAQINADYDHVRSSSRMEKADQRSRGRERTFATWPRRWTTWRHTTSSTLTSLHLPT